MKKNQTLKKVLSLWMLLLFVANIFLPTMVLASQSENSEAFIEITVEKRVLGQQDIVSLTKTPIILGEKASVAVERMFKSLNIEYDNTGTVESNFYISAIEDKDAAGGFLAEFDHGSVSGWKYSVNGVYPNVGLSDYEFKSGDKVRIQYTAKDMGQDILVVDTIYSIREKIIEAQNLNAENYTEESFNNLKAELAKLDGQIPSDEQIGQMMSSELGDGDCDTHEYGKKMENLLQGLESAISALEEKPVEPEVPTIVPQFEINPFNNWDKVDDNDVEQPNIIYLSEGQKSIGAKIIRLTGSSLPVTFDGKELEVVDGVALVEITPGLHTLSVTRWGSPYETSILCKVAPYTIEGNLVPGGTVTIDFNGAIEEGIKEGRRKLKETTLEYSTNIPGLKTIASETLQGSPVDRNKLSKVTFTIPKDIEPGEYELTNGGIVQTWGGISYGHDSFKGKFSILPNIKLTISEKQDLSNAYKLDVKNWSEFDKVYTFNNEEVIILENVDSENPVIFNGETISAGEDGYVITVPVGNNMLYVNGKDYELKCKKISYSIVGENKIIPGKKVTVQFEGLEKAFAYISGLHNPYLVKTILKSNVPGMEVVESKEAGSHTTVKDEILNQIEFTIPENTVPGEYEIFDGTIYQEWWGFSINGKNKKNFSIIPKVKFTVRDSVPEDNIAPEISTTLKENMEVSKEKLSFRATAIDDVDSSVDTIVKLNGEEVKAASAGQYNVVLNEGVNKIEISAEDKAGNVGLKEYTLTFTPKVKEGASIILDTLTLELKAGGTHQIIAVDAPDSRSNETENTLQMTYTVISGSDVVKVSKYGLVTALKPGFAEISVKYAGLTTPAIVQVQVMDDGEGNGPEIVTSIKETKYDTLYFTGDSYDYTFTVDAKDSEVTVQVNNEVVTPIDGKYKVNLTEGYNPIRITAESNGSISYKTYTIRAKKVEVVVENLSNKGQDIFQGDKVKVSFKGLETPVPKYLRVYNPKRTRVEYATDMPGATNIYGTPTQYDLPTKNAIEFTASSAGTFNFTGGNIEEAWWGDELYSERDISGDGPNMSAEVRQGNFSSLPDFKIEIKENKDYVNNYSIDILNKQPIKAGDKVTLRINNVEMPEADRGTILQALTIFNTNIEGLKEIKSEDAATDASKLQTINFKVPEGTKPGTYTITNGRVFKEWQPGVLYVDSEFYKGELPEVKLVIAGEEEIPVPPLDTTTPVEVISPSMTVEEGIKHAIKWTMENVKNPTFENEWDIIGLVRSEMFNDEEYLDTYYENLVQVVKDKKGILTRNKYTEYSRTIIALTALGKDPTDVGGYNLVEKLYDFNKVSRQGINGVIFALIALDTRDFEIPKDATNSREKMIQHILDSQLKDGGFTLMGSEGNVDVTGMAIQALSNYKDQPQVNKAIDKAVNFLSKVQLSDGGYESDGVKNIEASVQTLVGLTSVGIEPRSEGFVKDKNWIVSDMMNFAAPNSGFMHSLDQGAANDMATEQALYGLVSYKRFAEGSNSLYDMSDVSLDDGNDGNDGNGGSDGNGGNDGSDGNDGGNNGGEDSGNNGSGESGSGNGGNNGSGNNGSGNQSGGGTGGSNNGSLGQTGGNTNVDKEDSKKDDKEKEEEKEEKEEDIVADNGSNNDKGSENQCNHDIDENYNTASEKQPLSNIQVVFLTLAAVFVVSAIKEVVMMQIKKKKQGAED